MKRAVAVDNKNPHPISRNPVYVVNNYGNFVNIPKIDNTKKKKGRKLKYINRKPWKVSVG